MNIHNKKYETCNSPTHRGFRKGSCHNLHHSLSAESQGRPDSEKIKREGEVPQIGNIRATPDDESEVQSPQNHTARL